MPRCSNVQHGVDKAAVEFAFKHQKVACYRINLEEEFVCSGFPVGLHSMASSPRGASDIAVGVTGHILLVQDQLKMVSQWLHLGFSSQRFWLVSTPRAKRRNRK